MLVLSRQKDQSIRIGGDIIVKVVDIRGDKVRIGIEAPKSVGVHRDEVYEVILKENRDAAAMQPADLKPSASPPTPPMRLVPESPAVEKDAFTRAAIEEARRSLAEGGFPIASVLVRDGAIIGRGHDRRIQHRDPVACAEIDCLTKAGQQKTYADTTLYSTLLPGPLAAGAVIQFGIPRLIVAESANFAAAHPSGSPQTSLDYLHSHGIDFTDLNDSESTELLAQFLLEHPGLWA